MPKITALTGNDAVSYAMKQINPDVVAAYPITPQTTLMEKFAEYAADGIVDTEVVLVESEHSAMSATVGASSAGARAMTATSSQGFALMWEVVYIAAGAMGVGAANNPIHAMIAAWKWGAYLGDEGLKNGIRC